VKDKGGNKNILHEFSPKWNSLLTKAGGRNDERRSVASYVLYSASEALHMVLYKLEYYYYYVHFSFAPHVQ